MCTKMDSRCTHPTVVCVFLREINLRGRDCTEMHSKTKKEYATTNICLYAISTRYFILIFVHFFGLAISYWSHKNFPHLLLLLSLSSKFFPFFTLCVCITLVAHLSLDYNLKILSPFFSLLNNE